MHDLCRLINVECYEATTEKVESLRKLLVARREILSGWRPYVIVLRGFDGLDVTPDVFRLIVNGCTVKSVALEVHVTCGDSDVTFSGRIWQISVNRGDTLVLAFLGDRVK